MYYITVSCCSLVKGYIEMLPWQMGFVYWNNLESIALSQNTYFVCNTFTIILFFSSSWLNTSFKLCNILFKGVQESFNSHDDHLNFNMQCIVFGNVETWCKIDNKRPSLGKSNNYQTINWQFCTVIGNYLHWTTDTAFSSLHLAYILHRGPSSGHFGASFTGLVEQRGVAEITL